MKAPGRSPGGVSQELGWAWSCMTGFDSSTFLGFQNKAQGGERLYNGPGKPCDQRWLPLAKSPRE